MDFEQAPESFGYIVFDRTEHDTDTRRFCMIAWQSTLLDDGAVVHTFGRKGRWKRVITNPFPSLHDRLAVHPVDGQDPPPPPLPHRRRCLAFVAGDMKEPPVDKIRQASFSALASAHSPSTKITDKIQRWCTSLAAYTTMSTIHFNSRTQNPEPNHRVLHSDR